MVDWTHWNEAPDMKGDRGTVASLASLSLVLRANLVGFLVR